MNLKNKIKEDISNNKGMLYMKGTKEMPMCGFSATVVNILGMHKVEYKVVNVLENPQISATNLRCDALRLFVELRHHRSHLKNKNEFLWDSLNL